jgi:hypothetical protein
MKKLKKLEDLNFETEIDERKYLLKVVFQENDLGDDDFSINDLRNMYIEIQKTQSLNEKYDKNSIYWSEEQEKAIAEYINEIDFNKRNDIFQKKLYKPFKKLIENIIFTYKLYRTDLEAQDLQSDCLSFLVTKLEKFDTKSGTRAFAYFGTIAKHYLMGEKKTIYKQTIASSGVEESHNNIVKNEDYIFNPHKENEQDKNINIFNSIIESLEGEMQNEKMLEVDKIVTEAVIYVFKNHNMLDVYNRNLVYHLLKERTGLQGKEITYSLGRLKKFYKVFKIDFIKSKN